MSGLKSDSFCNEGALEFMVHHEFMPLQLMQAHVSKAPHTTLAIVFHPHWEQALFEQNNNESGALEPGMEEPANVLCVREVEGSINFIEDIYWGGFELKEGHDEWEHYQRPAQIIFLVLFFKWRDELGTTYCWLLV